MSENTTFNKGITTSQVIGGGVYVESQVVVKGKIHTYGQHYRETDVVDIPDAVEKFKAFYVPIYLKDLKHEDTLACCDEPRIMCNESFSYECTLEDGKMLVDTSDYCTDGFNAFECMNCNTFFDVDDLEVVSV